MIISFNLILHFIQVLDLNAHDIWIFGNHLKTQLSQKNYHINILFKLINDSFFIHFFIPF